MTEVKYETPRLATNTYSGDELRARDHKVISDAARLLPGEHAEVVYIHMADLSKPVAIEGSIIVGLTGLRIFKLEKGNVDYVFKEDIETVSHQKGGLFAWDKVVLGLTNGKTETFGIYNGDACELFCTRLDGRGSRESLLAAHASAREAARRMLEDKIKAL